MQQTPSGLALPLFRKSAAAAADPEMVSGYCAVFVAGNPILMSALSSCWGSSSSSALPFRCTRIRGRLFLPAVVREGLVGLGHLMGVVFLLHRVAAPVGGIQKLYGEALAHGLLAAVTRERDEPAHRQGHPALGAHLDRHLVRGAPYAATLDLELRFHVVEGLTKDLERLL